MIYLILIKNKPFKAVTIIFLSILILFSFSSKEVLAHEAYFLQFLIDDSNNTFVGNVVYDNSLMEANHIENKYNLSSSTKFTIPSSEKDKASSKHMERAYQIRDVLVPNLNQMLLIVNDQSNFTDTEEMLKAAKAITNGGSYNGWTVSINKDKTSLSKGNQSYSFVSSLPVGYTSQTLPNGSNSLVYNPDYDREVFISTKDIVNQAEIFHNQGVYAINSSENVSKPGVLESKLAELLNSFIIGVRNILGLYTIDELVYNDGLRGGDAYYKGVLPKQWFDVSVAFHLILQAIAWSLIGTAVIKTLLEINLSTLAGNNPIIRARIYDKMRDFFIVGFLLVGALLLFNTLLDLNSLLVGLFKTTIPQSGSFGNIFLDNLSLAGVFLSIFYLIINIFLNFTYVVRSITIAVLLATAPIFIISIVFQNKNTSFMAWFKELFSNIFLQSFHALIFSLVFSIQVYARPFEQLVIAASVIPLTNLFRQLITGNSGSMASSLGLGGLALVGGAVSTVKNSGSKTSGNKSGYNTSNSVPNAQEIPSRKQHSETAPSYRSTNKVAANSDANLDLEKNDFNSAGFRFNTQDASVKDIAKNSAKALGSIGLGVVETTAGLATFDLDDGHTFRSGFSSLVNGNKQLASNVLTTAKMGGNKAISKMNRFSQSKLGITPYENLKTPKETSPNKASEIKNNLSNVSTETQNAHVIAKNPIVRNVAQGFVNKTSGNILGSEILANGDRAVHRDRSQLKDLGLVDVRANKNGISTHVYNPNKLRQEDKDNLNYLYASRNEKHSYLQSRGVESITKDKNGNFVVEYNKTGRNHLGYDDIYQTNSRIVETKNIHQPLESRLTYNINDVVVPSNNANSPDYDDIGQTNTKSNENLNNQN